MNVLLFNDSELAFSWLPPSADPAVHVFLSIEPLLAKAMIGVPMMQ